MHVSWISEIFRRFAVTECKDSSPLYESLSLNISKDDDLLRLCCYAAKGQPIPNLLYASVHYLLLKGGVHPLREYYPSLFKEPKQRIPILNGFKSHFAILIEPFCILFDKLSMQCKRVEN
ncbi:DUF2332 family protein [Bacillus kexueae]|uniref:DUF2332 family protein n=1 Tax=Aeribacillus kexueae TaxID=2078952 RepID=UPI00311AA8DF